jgi:hypothetical protein
MHKLDMRGVVNYELYRGGELHVPCTTVPNGITNLAKNTLLNLMFNAGSSTGNTWYIGLIDAAGTVVLQATDVMNGTLSWAELSNYTTGGNNTLRPAWGKGSASGQAVTNASQATYDFAGISGTKSVHGIFVVNSSAKNGTDGLLWSTAAFLSPIVVQNGDQLRVTYTVQL